MQFKCILIDPPWPEYGGGKICRGAQRHYPLMSLKEILELPVQNLVHPDGAHLYLWATNNRLQDAFKCLEKWKFDYITTITWLKSGNPGLWQYYRGVTEHCLFASTKTKLPYKILGGKRQQGVTGFTAARQAHSQKPEEMRKMIETVSYPPYIELFSRSHTAGWLSVGNAINGEDITQSIATLTATTIT